ncbi:nitrilase/cyanide hydratase and apolipoprotein N-acyltransferase [Caulobacter sp. 602-2]|uniref:Nitrilase/cyanide hydratase and apolipoprotein N-acyltransferase n=1 Tax=Caulobacter sp. 602-2 TaxID=2710887 RepID=A0A6G4QS07_9CAUL|nr:nitrilase-related carbon-nitrogen hydrolase [Caulobacter sp. 602-2]NGM48436.1 nitrilase/cyanide hydratase and apolipoprotein N-acyltransferase [Caulobacter sp. 602-2]
MTSRQTFRRIKVAAVQAETVFLDLDAATARACELIADAGRQGADIIAFPENFLPAYPNWYETLSEGAIARELDKRLFLNSVEIPGDHIQAVAEACARAGVNAVVGVNERNPGTSGTMFNTQVHITRDGVIAGKHQKYVPTTGERQVQAPGTTGYYNTFKTDFGPVSSLICGENSNPLGIYAAARSYPLVHVASWPSYFGPPIPMAHAIKTASAGLAYGLKCFVLSSVLRIPMAYIDAVAVRPEDREYLLEQRAAKHGAMIFDPVGRMIADGTGQDDPIIYAEVDLSDVIIPKMTHDTAGHYNRPELFTGLFKLDSQS